MVGFSYIKPTINCCMGGYISSELLSTNTNIMIMIMRFFGRSFLYRTKAQFAMSIVCFWINYIQIKCNQCWGFRLLSSMVTLRSVLVMFAFLVAAYP